MKKIYAIGVLVFAVLLAGCNKSIVVTDDMLSGGVAGGDTATVGTGGVMTGMVDTGTDTSIVTLQ